MMTEKQIEIQDKLIQDLSLQEIKEMVAKGKPLDIGDVKIPEEEPYSEEELKFHKMSIEQIKELTKSSQSSPTTIEKAKKTGLSEKVISKIETNKYKATLEEITQYCKGLKIPFRDFVPELL